MRRLAFPLFVVATYLLFPVQQAETCPASSQNQLLPLGTQGKHIVLLQIVGSRSLDRKWMKGKSKRQRKRYFWGAPIIWNTTAWLRLLDQKGKLLKTRILVGKLRVREKRLTSALRRLVRLGKKTAKKRKGFRAGGRPWKLSCRWTRSCGKLTMVADSNERAVLRYRQGKRTLVRGPLPGFRNVNGHGAIGSNKVCIDRVVKVHVGGRDLLIVNLKKSELGGKCPKRRGRPRRCRKLHRCLNIGPKLQHQHASDTIWLLPRGRRSQ